MTERAGERAIDRELEERAAAAQPLAYAPYSRFPVGAAVRMGGKTYEGVNVESASYPLTVCAERNAIAAAASVGLRKPQAVAVVTDATPPSRPCGLCRQTLVEFAKDLPILVVNVDGIREETTLAEIFPQPFSLRG